MDSFAKANRSNWDNRAELHTTDEARRYYPIDRVLAGGSSLTALERREIGNRIVGKDIAHLQCHIGLDTISLKHLGAKSVTGLDFSPKALAAARRFAAQAGAEVSFVEASVYDAVAELDDYYDIVYVTWGTTIWLDDIFSWAKVVANLLRPGGQLYFLDGHPTMFQCGRKTDQPGLLLDWRTPPQAPLEWHDTHTYTGDERPLTHRLNYEWIHPLGDVVNALIASDMRIDFLNEHAILGWKEFPYMVEAGEGLYALPDGMTKIPLSVSIGATKQR
ncbi:class I SAM-dependent methyltransferase [Mesorhizobium sp. AR10]|uniref:class I SAM-dependent methyltransferase n=1 Tax=Mesorhizobium sp. AR10 TaxID=2865839 RepID=UPI00215F2011|nr:class I SAM-dependent methyltransferase [Mesorhizobium sp. AR10]UVK39759.1 class I SAM-dependent methyltransferase [Mesorhizobium sp. AR10]